MKYWLIYMLFLFSSCGGTIQKVVTSASTNQNTIALLHTISTDSLAINEIQNSTLTLPFDTLINYLGRPKAHFNLICNDLNTDQSTYAPFDRFGYYSREEYPTQSCASTLVVYIWTLPKIASIYTHYFKAFYEIDAHGDLVPIEYEKFKEPNSPNKKLQKELWCDIMNLD